MTTLPDPRHEAFAKFIAHGHDSASAYTLAGYSHKNVKSRSRDLAADPKIRDRIDHLSQCLPHITELQEYYAPSLAIMPDTQDQMHAWLWQIMNGSRKIQPIQLRAATLFCRMKGWLLTKPLPAEKQPTSKAAQLTQLERLWLAGFNRQNLHSDLTGHPLAKDALDNFQSEMADLDLRAQDQNPTGRPCHKTPELTPPLASDSEPSSESESDIAPTSPTPPPPDGEPETDPQTLHPQPSTPTPSPNGEKMKSAPSAPAPYTAPPHPKPYLLTPLDPHFARRIS